MMCMLGSLHAAGAAVPATPSPRRLPRATSPDAPLDLSRQRPRRALFLRHSVCISTTLQPEIWHWPPPAVPAATRALGHLGRDSPTRCIDFLRAASNGPYILVFPPLHCAATSCHPGHLGRHAPTRSIDLPRAASNGPSGARAALPSRKPPRVLTACALFDTFRSSKPRDILHQYSGRVSRARCADTIYRCPASGVELHSFLMCS
ncbi:hypothetical protein B0H15DRAFT_872271 [Mycena belliarum]|uniref:Uncharacterized protein n=1 Tax=Mycena belliarum TaxID=1033014 RepID=A0AAD6XDJ7_9AGAR|nr:hypothetical protein B0H15DRAFT_872271 [Mycena belliae]